MQHAGEFCGNDEPFVLCGDLNSRPLGTVYTYLSKGNVDARQVAPWNRMAIMAAQGEENSDLVDQMASLQMQDTESATIPPPSSSSSSSPPPQIRYLLDFTLNKLCRWLRILGIDTALESSEEEQLRTGEGRMILFDRCRQEGRTLITTSTRLVQRNDCPPGTYLISSQSVPNLEVILVHLLLTHGVQLDPNTFLTRCVVCNGGITDVQHVERKEQILKKHGYDAPANTAEEMDVFECASCQQGYWWSDRPNSSASRVKGTTTHLFELCLQAGVPLRDETSLGYFDYVDVQAQREKGWDFDRKGSELLLQDWDVVHWLKDDNVKSPFGTLRSAYAHKGQDGQNGVGESLPFTNVTIDFVDVLDYVWYDPSKLCVEDLLWIPSSFTVLNELGLKNGHILPSDVFPSDHLPVGAKLSRIRNKDPKEETTAAAAALASTEPPIQSTTSSTTATTTTTKANTTTGTSAARNAPPATDIMSMMTFAQQPHEPRCDCGCVPAIPSLFEMAAMRKQARLLAKQNAEKSSST